MSRYFQVGMFITEPTVYMHLMGDSCAALRDEDPIKIKTRKCDNAMLCNLNASRRRTSRSGL